MTIETPIVIRITALLESIGKHLDTVQLIPGAGSSRQYYRVRATSGESFLVCLGTNLQENKTFIAFSKQFAALKLHVPKVLAAEEEPWMYVIEDCGDTDLLEFKQNLSEPQMLEVYSQVLRDLVQFQIKGKTAIDYTTCFSRPRFDEVAMRWDLAYFKYYYVKLTSLESSEQRLEQDFDTLIAFLTQADSSYFMYRDFQSRNILMQQGVPYYIDFQGGMQGPLQYDVVSLLYQAKAGLTPPQREKLIDIYLQELSSYVTVNIDEFKKLLQGFVFIRILQTLGAYGYRGIIQKKAHFISSIPQAVYNVQQQNERVAEIIHIPYLSSVISQLPILTV